MILLGSQTMLHPKLCSDLVAAVKKLGIPCWLQGMCRGLLGDDPLHMKMDRKVALMRTDCLIVVCVVEKDFHSSLSAVSHLTSVLNTECRFRLADLSSPSTETRPT